MSIPKTPLPCSNTIRGFTSSSVISGKSVTSCDSRRIASTIASMSAGGSPADSAKQRVGSNLEDHVPRHFGGQRGNAEGDVTKHLDVDSAEAEHDEVAELRIVGRAEDDLAAGSSHLLNRDSLDLARRARSGGRC